MKFSLALSIIIFTIHSSTASAKRLEPKPVKSVSYAGLTYEAVHWPLENRKTTQSGGYVRVLNARNSMPICTKQVYATQYDETLERDVQDNFITSLKISKKNLIVGSEKHAPIEIPLENFCD